MNDQKNIFEKFIIDNSHLVQFIPNSDLAASGVSNIEHNFVMKYLDNFNISIEEDKCVLISLSAQELYALLVNLQRDILNQTSFSPE